MQKKKKQGVSLQLCLSCTICEFCYSFWTSKKAEKMRSYDINKRSVYALHRLGKGYPGEDILNNYELATTYDWKKTIQKLLGLFTKL